VLDRARELIIDKEFIEFDDKDLLADPPTKIYKQDISGIRYGIKWIHGYQFVIGRIYCVDVLARDKRCIKIRLKTLYGIRKHQLADKYSLIINSLFDNFFDDISRNYLNQHHSKQEFQIAGVRFCESGIAFDSKSQIVLWDDLASKAFTTYYALFSKSDPLNYKAFEYLHDWNVGVLYTVSRQILTSKGLHSE
jgi:hypothetical protein